MVIIEASEGLKRYRIIEEALSLWLENRKRLSGGFRVLTINEDLYNQLVSIGNGSAEAGLRRLLEAYHNHQLVAPSTQAQPQAWAQAEPQVQAQSGEDEVELGFLENNPWVNIIKSRGTRSN
jgi:arabinogalactan endo-1,4-beta-galactosidase